jgi:hypothetical protein
MFSGASLDIRLNGVDPDQLLRTCRRQDDRELDAVQLLSWLVTCYSWLVLQNRPDSGNLSCLRPGARCTVRSGYTDGEDALARAAEAVDAAGVVDDKTSSLVRRRTLTARHKAALKQLPRLVHSISSVSPGDSALAAPGEPGIDAWVWPKAGPVLLMQSKGVQSGEGAGKSGGDKAVTSATVRAYVENAAKAWPSWLAGIGPDASKPKEVVIELLDLHRAGKRLVVPEPPEGVSAVVVITRQELQQAMGPVFGGIAARCGKL